MAAEEGHPLKPVEPKEEEESTVEPSDTTETPTDTVPNP